MARLAGVPDVEPDVLVQLEPDPALELAAADYLIAVEGGRVALAAAGQAAPDVAAAVGPAVEAIAAMGARVRAEVMLCRAAVARLAYLERTLAALELVPRREVCRG